MEKIQWAKKLSQSKILRLYQSDAAGILDDSLLEEVGYDLLERCKSIQLVTSRQVECPRCGTAFPMCEPDSWKYLEGVQTCPTPGCGWQTTAEEWHNSWRHRELLGAAAVEAFNAYLQDFPQARTPPEQMVCIDQLIHAFHISLHDGGINRSFANNLIEGSHEQVVELLDSLFEGRKMTGKEQWRAEIDAMWKRRRNQAG